MKISNGRPPWSPWGSGASKTTGVLKICFDFLADSAPWQPCVNFENDPLSLLFQSPSQKLNESVINNSKN